MLSLREYKGIDAARVFMILGVILIHCNILETIPPNDSSLLVDTSVKFLSVDFPRFCVPWFFFISAYISGRKYGNSTFITYKNILKKRCKSLLLPYLLWNTLALLIWQAVNMTFLNEYTSGGYVFTSLRQFVIDVYISPILLPLWFLRNLMICIILLPLLNKLLHINTLLPVLFSIIINRYAPFEGILYYSLGLVLSKHFEYLKIFFRYAYFLAIIYISIVLYSDITDFNIFNIPVLRECVILIGLFAFWKIGQDIKVLRANRFTSSMVFFVYAFHGIISPYVIKGLALIIPWHNNYWLLDYALVYLMVAMFSYICYLSLSKYMPNIFRILTGQREHNPKFVSDLVNH